MKKEEVTEVDRLKAEIDKLKSDHKDDMAILKNRNDKERDKLRKALLNSLSAIELLRKAMENLI